jgi:hypothetical protein
VIKKPPNFLSDLWSSWYRKSRPVSSVPLPIFFAIFGIFFFLKGGESILILKKKGSQIPDRHYPVSGGQDEKQ